MQLLLILVTLFSLHISKIKKIFGGLQFPYNFYFHCYSLSPRMLCEYCIAHHQFDFFFIWKDITYIFVYVSWCCSITAAYLFFFCKFSFSWEGRMLASAWCSPIQAVVVTIKCTNANIFLKFCFPNLLLIKLHSLTFLSAFFIPSSNYSLNEEFKSWRL